MFDYGLRIESLICRGTSWIYKQIAAVFIIVCLVAAIYFKKLRNLSAAQTSCLRNMNHFGLLLRAYCEECD